MAMDDGLASGVETIHALEKLIAILYTNVFSVCADTDATQQANKVAHFPRIEIMRRH